MESSCNKLRLATYNIHGGWGMDKVLDLKRIADVIKSMNVDFISINEIDYNCGRSEFENQPQILAELLEMNYHVAPALEMRSERFPEQGDQVGLYGVAFFTPHPINVIKQIMLPGLPEMEPRTAVIVRVDAPHHFYAIVTHFCWEPQYEQFRTASVDAINAEAAVLRQQDAEAPIVLLGDLNAEPYSAPIEVLRKNWVIAKEGDFQATHPADMPREIIDYIMFLRQERLHWENEQIVLETVASDHRPLLADLILV